MCNSFLKVSSCSPSDCLFSQNINRWRIELFFFSCRLIHPWLSLTLIKETWHWLNRLSTPPKSWQKPLCCRLRCCLSFRLRSAPLLIVKDARERQRCCVLKGRGTAEECGLRWMSAEINNRQFILEFVPKCEDEKRYQDRQCVQGYWLLKSYHLPGL